MRTNRQLLIVENNDLEFMMTNESMMSYWATILFSDPPEIEIEQNWYERDGVVEVEIICVVHANPEAEVIYAQNNIEIKDTLIRL